MSDSFLYNQEVTTEMLNDIAVDLGYTSFNGFDDETKFGASELNGITASLVSEGILINGDNCRPIVSDNKVIIQTGIIVFGNGAKKKITEVVSIDLVADSYVYAANRTTAGKCEIVVSQTDPATTEDDYVLLAQIDSGKNLIDKREIATSKVALNSGNFYCEYELDSGYAAQTLKIPLPVWEKTKILLLDSNGSRYFEFEGFYTKDIIFDGELRLYTDKLMLGFTRTESDVQIQYHVTKSPMLYKMILV